VNEYMETNQPDVYAAGDVAQVYDPITKKAMVDSLWDLARKQGASAGINMSGGEVAYQKEVPFNVTRLAGLTTTIIGTVGNKADAGLMGIARGESETWHTIPDAIACQDNFDVNRLRILVGEKHILGAVVMGNQTLSQPIQHLVTNKVDITPIRQMLLEPSSQIAEILTKFWTAWRSKYAEK
jgi:NADPH-dependent 2,4-dienoyl-CoA reductase/sulfur reductase-like enzyme